MGWFLVCAPPPLSVSWILSCFSTKYVYFEFILFLANLHFLDNFVCPLRRRYLMHSHRLILKIQFRFEGELTHTLLKLFDAKHLARHEYVLHDTHKPNAYPFNYIAFYVIVLIHLVVISFTCYFITHCFISHLFLLADVVTYFLYCRYFAFVWYGWVHCTMTNPIWHGYADTRCDTCGCVLRCILAIIISIHTQHIHHVRIAVC